MKRVRLPLDHLAELWPNDMKGARIGALLHPASVSASLRHTSQILEELSGQLFRLAAFFGPQHGFLGQTQDNMVEWTSYRHPRLGIPIYSLYGETRQPTAEMLEGLDVFLVDLQDIGARYYTFVWTMYGRLALCFGANPKSTRRGAAFPKPIWLCSEPAKRGACAPEPKRKIFRCDRSPR